MTDPRDVDRYADAVLAGSRTAVARAITLVESSRPDHRLLAQQVLTRLLPHADAARRVGITGVPGVGKSTFIDALGGQLIDCSLSPAPATSCEGSRRASSNSRTSSP